MVHLLSPMKGEKEIGYLIGIDVKWITERRQRGNMLMLMQIIPQTLVEAENSPSKKKNVLKLE